MCESEREKEKVCVCVCEIEREREGGRERQLGEKIMQNMMVRIHEK